MVEKVRTRDAWAKKGVISNSSMGGGGGGGGFRRKKLLPGVKGTESAGCLMRVEKKKKKKKGKVSLPAAWYAVPSLGTRGKKTWGSSAGNRLKEEKRLN